MVMRTSIKCSKEAEHHDGPLRRVSDEYVCQECWNKERGIEAKQAKGRPVICPDCGKVLMTKFKGGKGERAKNSFSKRVSLAMKRMKPPSRISITSLSMKGSKAILDCDCGYKKSIPNPFGKHMNRDEAARLKITAKKAKDV